MKNGADFGMFEPSADKGKRNDGTNYYQIQKIMKPTILTQKNVCAFLSLLMALTILWAARAEAKTDISSLPTVNQIEYTGAVDVTLPAFELDMSDIEDSPTVTLMNKYGEVVAEFYGDRNEVNRKFKGAIEAGTLLAKVGKTEFVLVR